MCASLNDNKIYRIIFFNNVFNFYQDKIKELEVDYFDLKNEIVEIQISLGRFIF